VTMSVWTVLGVIVMAVFVGAAALMVAACVVYVREHKAGRPAPHRTRGELSRVPVTRAVMLAWVTAPADRTKASRDRWEAARAEVCRVMPDLAAQLDRLEAEWTSRHDDEGRRLAAAAARAANTGEAHAHMWQEDGSVPGVQVCPCGAMRALA
jgi:hypothetical protein